MVASTSQMAAMTRDCWVELAQWKWDANEEDFECRISCRMRRVVTR